MLHASVGENIASLASQSVPATRQPKHASAYYYYYLYYDYCYNYYCSHSHSTASATNSALAYQKNEASSTIQKKTISASTMKELITAVENKIQDVISVTALPDTAAIVHEILFDVGNGNDTDLLCDVNIQRTISRELSEAGELSLYALMEPHIIRMFNSICNHVGALLNILTPHSLQIIHDRVYEAGNEGDPPNRESDLVFQRLLFEKLAYQLDRIAGLILTLCITVLSLRY